MLYIRQAYFYKFLYGTQQSYTTLYTIKFIRTQYYTIYNTVYTYTILPIYNTVYTYTILHNIQYSVYVHNTTLHNIQYSLYVHNITQYTIQYIRTQYYTIYNIVYTYTILHNIQYSVYVHSQPSLQAYAQNGIKWIWVLATSSNFLIPILLQPDGVNLDYLIQQNS